MLQDTENPTMSKPERVSSRLIKKERNKILKQTVWFIGGGVVLVLAFLFFVLPNFINAINSVLSTNPIAEEETVLLQAPELVAPVSATYSAQLAVSGVGTSGLKAVVVVNGNPSSELETDEEGNFETTIDLTEGENSISAYSIDEKGNESNTGRNYIVVMDNQPPELEVTEPQDGQEFDSKQSTITVTGKTEPNTKIYLNGRFFLPRADGTFSTTFSINPGDNELKIQAIDEAGNQVELERTVKRK